MIVTALRLRNWRNFADESYFPTENVNTIYGSNAQGKTNLLEAIYYASRGTAFRAGRERDLIRSGCDKGSVSLDFTARGRKQRIELEIFASGGKKTALLNGVPVERMSELSGALCTVLFAPEHLGLVKEGPELRRQFLDIAISQLRSKYGAALSDYNRVLAQRNFLLKRGGGKTMPAWDERLAALGSYIVMMRGTYVEKLSAGAAAHHASMIEGEELTFRYRSFTDDTALLRSLEGLREFFLSRLAEAAPRDRELGSTTVGPHRDDLDISLNGSPARIFASQGQQRSIVLSMKLAECDIICGETGESPVLLLDDIMSELDRDRRSYVSSRLKGRQVIITATTASRRRSGVVKISEGKICTST